MEINMLDFCIEMLHQCDVLIHKAEELMEKEKELGLVPSQDYDELRVFNEAVG
jgi:hypothetical protein